MKSTEDPRAVYDRAIESHRAHYRDLRQIAVTLVYLRTKLEAEHPEQRTELQRIADEAERAKEALAHVGHEIRALERERLRAIAALSTARVGASPVDVDGLADARDQIERIAAEIEIERLLQ